MIDDFIGNAGQAPDAPVECSPRLLGEAVEGAPLRAGKAGGGGAVVLRASGAGAMNPEIEAMRSAIERWQRLV